jgi:two-component system sensor histidine kinase TctE
VDWDIKLRKFDLRYSLHTRIITFIGLILAAGAILLGFAAWQYATVAARESYDKLLIGGAVQIAENVYVQGSVVTLDPPVAMLSTLSAYDLVFYKVVDPRGVVIAGDRDLLSGVQPTRTHEGVTLADGLFQGRPVRIATIGKKLDNPRVGGWTEIVIAQTLTARQTLAWDLTEKAVELIAVMSVLALSAGALSVRIALAPLRRLENEISSRKPEDLRPIRVEPPNEVKALVGAIDDFMRRLSDRIDRMQRFIGDAAHQIRTPLASIDAQAEMLCAADGIVDSAAVAQLRQRILELGRLSSQLLDHAMIIHRSEAVAFKPVDLGKLAKSTLAQAVPLSLEREVSVSFHINDGNMVVLGDEISLREAISNLIHNALKHGAPTRLALDVSRNLEFVWVTVSDDGLGIPEENQEKMIEPFQLGAASSGSGLGLAIASDVARAHGGRLKMQNGPDGFSVSLEMAALRACST